jgi:hypothetical protein
MQPEQAKGAEFSPEGGQRVRLRLEQGTGRCARLVVSQEIGHGLREGTVF